MIKITGKKRKKALLSSPPPAWKLVCVFLWLTVEGISTQKRKKNVVKLATEAFPLPSDLLCQTVKMGNES